MRPASAVTYSDAVSGGAVAFSVEPSPHALDVKTGLANPKDGPASVPIIAIFYGVRGAFRADDVVLEPC